MQGQQNKKKNKNKNFTEGRV